MDWYWTRNSNQSRFPSGKKDWILFFVMVNYLEKKMVRLISGDLRIIFGGRAKCKEAEATRKDFKIVLTRHGQESLYLRAVQDRSGRNPIDPTFQDNAQFWTISSSTFIMLDVQSVYTPSQIQDWYRWGQNSSRERQTVLFTAVNPMDKEHKDPYKLDLTKPRLARYKQKKWKKHQDTVYWVDTQLARRKGLKFYQTRCNAINHPLRYTPSLLYLESCCDGIRRNSYTRKFLRHLDHLQRFLFKDYWMKELDSEVAGSSKDTERIQPKPKNPIIKNGETRGWTTVHPEGRHVCHRWRWHGLWHSHRLKLFAKVTVILSQSEWSIAKDVGPFKRCNARHWQTFFK